MTRISNPNDAVTGGQPSAPNGKTILIAEDDPFISRMYETKLRYAGFDVVVKNNGRDAYEEIKLKKPDLIILDINMPELTGLEVLSALQGDGFDFNTTPVMMLTNSANQSDRDTAKKYNVDYLIKAEMTPREVLELIHQKLNMQPGGA
jgi:CheY-like chemotaxis protein